MGSHKGRENRYNKGARVSRPTSTMDIKAFEKLLLEVRDDYEINSTVFQWICRDLEMILKLINNQEVEDNDGYCVY